MTGSKKILHALVRHRAVVLGAIFISLVWMAVFFFLKNEHDSAERAAIQNSTNLAGAFEEHLSRSLIRGHVLRDAEKKRLVWSWQNRSICRGKRRVPFSCWTAVSTLPNMSIDTKS
jgi:hypothetical protein